jgi:L-lysine 6-transaminase
MKPMAATSPEVMLAELQEHILTDGFGIVIDFARSRGPYLWDAASGRRLLDLYGFYGSLPIGFNHPHFDRPEVQQHLADAARTKVANSDVYSEHLAMFVRTFHRVMGLPGMDRYFFIDGGALAVENALKAAMDWKVRKNLAAGRGERGTAILHFERAFHGRSGYTMSLTNTDPKKTALFAKFPWPRVSTPSIDFSLPEAERTRDVIQREKQAEQQIRVILQQRSVNIAAIIIEPIQGEGGDNHFRGEWLRTLRRFCDEYDLLLIFDEVQTGFGTTGKRWCCEHFGVRPDLIAFGKKSQTCGVIAGPRLDEVPENVFRLPSRINSTWGGNLADMVRSSYIMEIIERDHLLEHVARTGRKFVEALEALAREEPLISAVRGRGHMIAFDLPDKEAREQFYRGLFESSLLAIRSGERSIRFRPVLDFPENAVDEAIELLRRQCRRMREFAPTETPAPELVK